MNLKTTSDKELVLSTEKLVGEERNILTQILHHLREIERRRLYSALGYKSLFEFTVKKLGYSEDQAYRRISAMRLISELPEVEEKINCGEISLTHIGLAQSLFKQERKAFNEFTKTEKLDVFNKISLKPIREAEKITYSMSSEPLKPKRDRIQNISDKYIELQFTASYELKQKIERLKGMLAHKSPDISLGELIEKLCDLGLTEWDPSRALQKRNQISKQCEKGDLLETRNRDEATNQVATRNQAGALNKTNLIESVSKFAAIQKRCVKVAVRREVFRRANNQCQRCGSTYALEVDHIFPKSFGGSDGIENLRLLCRSCNQRAAVESIGVRKMEGHLQRL